MASALYSRIMDDREYFTHLGKSLQVEALDLVLNDLGQKGESASASTVVASLRRAIQQLRAATHGCGVDKEGNTDRKSVSLVAQSNLKIVFLSGYLPKSLATLDLVKLIDSVLDKYQADSLNFLPIVSRDVLASIASVDLEDEETVNSILVKIRLQLMRRLRRYKLAQQQKELQRQAAELQQQELQEAVEKNEVSLFHDYSVWSYHSPWQQIPRPQDSIG